MKKKRRAKERQHRVPNCKWLCGVWHLHELDGLHGVNKINKNYLLPNETCSSCCS